MLRANGLLYTKTISSASVQEKIDKSVQEVKQELYILKTCVFDIPRALHWIREE